MVRPELYQERPVSLAPVHMARCCLDVVVDRDCNGGGPTPEVEDRFFELGDAPAHDFHPVGCNAVEVPREVDDLLFWVRSEPEETCHGLDCNTAARRGALTLGRLQSSGSSALE